MAQKLKTAEQMARHFKGMANHYRISIMLIVDADDKITVEDITDRLNANFKTISQHTRYLTQTGLIRKQYKGRTVAHSLSPYGKIFIKFTKEFQRTNFI